MAEVHHRSVPAPADEWLTRQQLCNAIDINPGVLKKLIRQGKFPRGTPWDGKEQRWRWWVVVWWRLQKDVEPLMRAGPVAFEEDEDDGEDDGSGGK